MALYRRMVSNRLAARDRGLTVVALSRLTWSAADQRAWDEAYVAALLLGVGRLLQDQRDSHPVARFNTRGPRIVEARAYPSAAAVMEGEA